MTSCATKQKQVLLADSVGVLLVAIYSHFLLRFPLVGNSDIFSRWHICSGFFIVFFLD